MTDEDAKRNTVESIFKNYWNERNPELSDELLSTAILQDTSLNQLEELLAAKTSEENKENEENENLNQKNLRLSTFGAPVFYANLGDGNELSKLLERVATAGDGRAVMGKRSREIVSDWSPDAFGDGIWRAVEAATQTSPRKVTWVDQALLRAMRGRL